MSRKWRLPLPRAGRPLRMSTSSVSPHSQKVAADIPAGLNLLPSASSVLRRSSSGRGAIKRIENAVRSTQAWEHEFVPAAPMTVPLHQAKARLRQLVRERVKGMTPQQREAASRRLCDNLRQQAIWKRAAIVLFFAPLPGEPDLWPLLGEALRAGRTVALPRFSPATQHYVACAVQNLKTDLQAGPFGIREPNVSCPEIPSHQLALALVPGVAFDLRGNRLGRGKGFYDRLLTDVRGVKCGVAFDEQVVDAVPVGPQDVRLDLLVTPTRGVSVG
jgi:5-formyltetrahydrofolate cyclo-ligase